MEMEEVSTLALTVIGALEASFPFHPENAPMAFGIVPIRYLFVFFSSSCEREEIYAGVFVQFHLKFVVL
jgi:hypothetical protein